MRRTMVMFLAGGTGAPKLPDETARVFDLAETTVVVSTGNDVELGGHLVCPDVDTVLFADGGVFDTDRWWGIASDTTVTDDELHRLADTAGLESGPQYLPGSAQTTGHDIARWRHFSDVAAFMEIGDRDRAIHTTRTSLLDEGNTLTEVMRTLAGAFDLDVSLRPMSDDPMVTLIHTNEGTMHFQEYWVHRRADPTIRDVEFRGADDTTVTDAVTDTLEEPVVAGSSNPVTSIGPMLATDGFANALDDTSVVAVSPSVGGTAFSGPAADLMAGVGYELSTVGVAVAYPFTNAFVPGTDDGTDLDHSVVKTDTRIDGPDDAERVARTVSRALTEVL